MQKKEEVLKKRFSVFDINPHFWYSYLDMSVDFRGEIKDVEFMLKELKKYIKRFNNGNFRFAK